MLSMISAQDVTLAFRKILHREPESDAVIEHHQSFGSMQELCHALIGSEEFLASIPQSAPPPSNHVVVPDDALTTDDLAQAADDFNANRKERWAGRVMALPDWFDPRMDPYNAAYRDQMLRFWSAITARDRYVPGDHEDTPEIAESDAIYRPAFYASGDTAFSGGQMMAMGHIILRSHLKPGDRMLEYGAGFGQTALALARLGVHVDTVDINPAFCRAVQTSAERYQVALHPHVGEFGFNPAGQEHAYDMILFYESFHHCLDFIRLIERLPKLLKPHGRVILAGEPIFHGPSAEMPYPWGFRLDWENVAIMRHRGWMELGFQQNFLLDLFSRAGFDCAIHTDPNSHWAQVYEFVQRQ
jgi:2-polyprenyl-3-methyl-5-hydroxy-6-metoxy-1,4-benzoquinol methylase